MSTSGKHPEIGAYRRAAAIREENRRTAEHRLALPEVSGVSFHEGRRRQRPRRIGVGKMFYRPPTKSDAVEYFVPPDTDIPQGWLAIRHPETLEWFQREKPYVLGLFVLLITGILVTGGIWGVRAYREAQLLSADNRTLPPENALGGVGSTAHTAVSQAHGRAAFLPFLEALQKESDAGDTPGVLRVLERVSNQSSADPWFWLEAGEAIEPFLVGEPDVLTTYRQRFFEYTVRFGANDPFVQEQLGQLEAAKGNREAAIRVWNEAIRRGHTRPETIRAKIDEAMAEDRSAAATGGP